MKTSDVDGVFGRTDFVMYPFAAGITCIDIDFGAKNGAAVPRVPSSAAISVCYIRSLYGSITYLCYEGQTWDILTLNFEISGFTTFSMCSVRVNCHVLHPMQVTVLPPADDMLAPALVRQRI